MERIELKLSSGKNIIVNELKWVDVFSDSTRLLREKNSYQHVMLQLATGMSDEEIEGLSMKDGSKLFKIYMKLNEDNGDFQEPQEKDAKE